MLKKTTQANKLPKIAFFSESGFVGKTTRNYKNMRTEYAWYASLQATHIPIDFINYKPFKFKEHYDIGIVIVPKNFKEVNFDILRTHCDYVGIMQEGPSSNWEDLPINLQNEYYWYLQKADFIFCHNEIDKGYFEGLTFFKTPVYVMPTLMIEEAMKGINKNSKKENKTIIGGNFCRWYGGFPSYIVATKFQNNIFAPSMGRMKEKEKSLKGLNHLPYMCWYNWMKTLSTFKYAVHLLRNYIAGTFALNCAYFGIPCIGYEKLDTQRLCHPFTTVPESRVDLALDIAQRLRKDKKFYEMCSYEAKERYSKVYSEDSYLNKLLGVFDTIMKK